MEDGDEIGIATDTENADQNTFFKVQKVTKLEVVVLDDTDDESEETKPDNKSKFT